MAAYKWRCSNYDGCDKAEAQEVFETPVPIDLCPFCNQPTLIPVESGRGIPWKSVGGVLAIVAAIAIPAALLVVYWPTSPSSDSDLPELAVIETLEVPQGEAPADQEPPAAGKQRTARDPLVFPGFKTLRFKILTRPEASIYTAADQGSDVVQSRVPNFSKFFVYAITNRTKNGTGKELWYEVGRTDRGGGEGGKSLGWMKGNDVIEWRHSLAVKFTSPADRSPALFFRNAGELQGLTKLGRSARKSRLDELANLARQGRIASSDPILPVLEPEGAISEFYFLPVLDFTNNVMDSRNNLLLQVTAATRNRAASNQVDSARSSKVKVDVTFVMDLTISMEPYVAETVVKMREFAVLLASSEGSGEALRFGFWGFRDNESIPGMEFNTRNYTPQLVPLEDFGRVLEKVTVAKQPSDDLAEDLFTGVYKGITETAWRKDATRLLILIGDASGHPAGDQRNQCGMSEGSLRALANDRKVWITGVHILNPGDSQSRGTPNDPRLDHTAAAAQFRGLAQNPDGGDPVYLTVEGERSESVFARELKRFTDQLHVMVRSAEQGKLVPIEASSSGNDLLIQRMFRGALLDWVSRGTSAAAPRDVTGWVSKTDLSKGDTPVLNYYVLLNKNELDSLHHVVKEIHDAAVRGKATSADLFESLQAADVAVFRDPEKIRTANTLKDHVPEFLQGLPYKSAIMSLTRDQWKAMGENARGKFLTDLAEKLKYYERCNSEGDEKWTRLNEDDDPSEYVATIEVDRLP